MLLACVALPWMWAREIPEERWREAQWECSCTWFSGLGAFSPFWAQDLNASKNGRLGDKKRPPYVIKGGMLANSLG